MSKLFEKVKLGDLELPHRIVMAPLTRSRAGEERVPNQMMARYYKQRATAALIITEATYILPDGIGYPFTPGIGTGKQVEGWKKITEAVHAEGGKIFLQLWHVGRISHPVLQENGKKPVAPSAIKPKGKLFTGEGMVDFEEPRALETSEIPGIVADFKLGAENAKKAGFDGVEIHGANGYLLDQFLNDSTNKRTDEYGGSIENRARLLLEVVEAVTSVWGKNRVGVRLSPTGTFNDMKDSDPPALWGFVAEKLGEMGIAYLHVIEPEEANRRLYKVDGEIVSPTADLKSKFKGTVITAQGYDLESANAVLESGHADLVAFGKKFLANPDLPKRLKLGAELNEQDPSTFYGGAAEGYTDYPTLEEAKAAKN